MEDLPGADARAVAEVARDGGGPPGTARGRAPAASLRPSCRGACTHIEGGSAGVDEELDVGVMLLPHHGRPPWKSDGAGLAHHVQRVHLGTLGVSAVPSDAGGANGGAIPTISLLAMEKYV